MSNVLSKFALPLTSTIASTDSAAVSAVQKVLSSHARALSMERANAPGVVKYKSDDFIPSLCVGAFKDFKHHFEYWGKNGQLVMTHFFIHCPKVSLTLSALEKYSEINPCNGDRLYAGTAFVRFMPQLLFNCLREVFSDTKKYSDQTLAKVAGHIYIQIYTLATEVIIETIPLACNIDKDWNTLNSSFKTSMKILANHFCVQALLCLDQVLDNPELMDNPDALCSSILRAIDESPSGLLYEMDNAAINARLSDLFPPINPNQVSLSKKSIQLSPTS